MRLAIPAYRGAFSSESLSRHVPGEAAASRSDLSRHLAAFCHLLERALPFSSNLDRRSNTSFGHHPPSSANTISESEIYPANHIRFFCLDVLHCVDAYDTRETKRELFVGCQDGRRYGMVFRSERMREGVVLVAPSIAGSQRYTYCSLQQWASHDFVSTVRERAESSLCLPFARITADQSQVQRHL